MDIDPFYKQLGATIRHARAGLGITQADLAQIVGLSRTSLTNIELGRQRILVDQLAELASALHVSVSSLIPERKPQVVEEDDSKMYESMPTVSNFLNTFRQDKNA